MEQYLRRNRLSELMDGLGVRALIYLLALMWFVWLRGPGRRWERWGSLPTAGGEGIPWPGGKGRCAVAWGRS